ncbi:hypothetical protein [Paenibacillus sp. DMB20]|uniref:hypothetical protein n=1 Tax=Paenibacillus sp. DMB20 TaxID=1642570 RepID=UPI0006276C9E|nr:hypothetical protein [Paenibacillus sp. DMB20]KKO52736.1 hypothetical protein XI25_18130 [Paenibacillus sp. DMB20]
MKTYRMTAVIVHHRNGIGDFKSCCYQGFACWRGFFLTRIAANPSQLNLGAFSKEFTAAQAEAASLQVVGHVLLQTKDIITPRSDDCF